MRRCHSKVVICLLGLLLVTNKLYSQETKSIIYWTNDRKLTWEDFKKKKQNKDIRQGYTASVYTNLDRKIKFEGDLLITNTSALLVKPLSWVVVGLQDSLALKHEQVHFDIAEVFGRKFRKTLSGAEFSGNRRTIRKLFFEDYRSIMQQLGEFNDLYDKETNHGLIEEKQQEWNTRIAKELLELEEYANTEIIIELNK